MMYQSDGLQTEDRNPAKPFLGAFAEDIIADIKRKRQLEEGEYAMEGAEGMEIKSPGRIENYA